MLRFIKEYGSGVIVIAMIAAIFGWYNAAIKAAEAQGQADLLAEQSDSTFAAVLDSVNGSWEVRKAAWDSTRLSLRAEVDSGVARLGVMDESALEASRTARNTIATVSERPVPVLTAEELAQIELALDNLEASNRECISTLGSCRTLVRAADTRIWDLEAQQRQSLDLNRQQNVTINRLRELRKPAIGWLGYGGWLTAGVMTVLLVVR